MKRLKTLLSKLKHAIRKPKPYMLDGKYRIVPAFEWEGEVYYMHEDPLNTLTGRGLSSMMFIEEMMMRCDVGYLNKHIEAMDAIFSDPRKVSLQDVFRLNANLKERVNLLAAIPKHVYKLASVVFFTKDESPYKYDFAKGMEKVRRWEAADGMYDFFLQTPLVTLIPSLALPKENSENYLKVVKQIDEIHLQQIRQIVSARTSAKGMKK